MFHRIVFLKICDAISQKEVRMSMFLVVWGPKLPGEEKGKRPLPDSLSALIVSCVCASDSKSGYFIV